MLLLSGRDPHFRATRNVVRFIGDAIPIDARAAAGDEPLGLTPAGGKADRDKGIDQAKTLGRLVREEFK